MNYQSRPSQVHLTRKDLNGVGDSLRTIFTVADNGEFDGLLKRLDAAFERCPNTADRSRARRWG